MENGLHHCCQRLLLSLLFIAPIHFLQAQDSTKIIKQSPFVLGVVYQIKSKLLSETRTLNVYLPEGFNDKDTTGYPVIYLLDGSADEDFIHIAGLVQFANFPWVNLLPKSIVVGIANTDRRRDLTYPTTIAKDKKEFPTTGGSAKFISFIEKEVQPFIQSRYKTSSAKTIIGQSLGGLLASEILLKKPALFTTYIIISPSLWWDNQSLLSIADTTAIRPPVNVYISVGNEGKVMEDDAKKLLLLLQKTADKKSIVRFQYLPNENHATILHRAVYNAFESFSQQKKEKE